MSYGSVLLRLALLSPVLFQPTAVAQPAPQAVDDKNCIAAPPPVADPVPPFELPGDLVALGPFKRVERVGEKNVTLQVDKHFYEIVKNRKYKIKIAFKPPREGEPKFLDHPLIDETSGDIVQVIWNKPCPGRYVVVSESIANEFPIVTHWKQTLNKGRGGRKIGGTDAVEKVIGDNSSRPGFYDSNSKSPQSPLWSRKNALFSSDNVAPNAYLPAYERYPGEGYSLVGLSTDGWARLFSDKTGFSVRHLNGRSGCRAVDVLPEAPFFQVVHACPIGQSDKMSLATLVIPPRWNRSGHYPVLFYPDRDLHFSFDIHGTTIVKSIGDSDKRSAIGVVWNAGAGYGSSGLQRSMYDNASRLFELLKTSFSADTDKIVAVGCSRGGSEALAIAGNPYPHSYKVKEVLAYSPDVAYGTRYKEFTSPTYPGMVYNHGIFTGYKYAWRQGWREEQTGHRGFEVILKNTFDTVDPDQADQLSPISDKFLIATKYAGTRIYLSIATNDQFMPFPTYIPYVNKAMSYGIPMRVRIDYRGSHCGSMHENLQRDSVDALARVNAGEETVSSEIKYYAAPFSQAGGFRPIEHGQQPVAIQLPSYITPNGTFLYSVSGGPGVYFRLEIFKKNGTSPILNFSGRLPPMDPEAPLRISTYTERLHWPATVPVGSYYYKLAYRLENSEWTPALNVPKLDSKPTGEAEFTVMAEEPMASSADFCDKMPEVVKIIGCSADPRVPKVGWGLSSH
jgi:hypothetical protein